MELRGRHPHYQDLESQILRLLSDTNDEIGFRQLFTKLGVDPKTMRAHISKSTLASTLKFLQSQNKIKKTENGKYAIIPGEDHMPNVRRLKRLLHSLDEIIIPTLKPLEKAYIGIKLWTVIFQNEFHPAQEFRHNKYQDISNKSSKSKRKRIIEEFFESKRYSSIFEDQMYELFFDFCGQFSPSILEEAISKAVANVPNQFEANEKKIRSLVYPFQKEIFVKRHMHVTYYGIAFCNILFQTNAKTLNKETLELFRRNNIFSTGDPILNIR